MKSFKLIIVSLTILAAIGACAKSPPTINRTPKQKTSDKIAADDSGNKDEKGGQDRKGSILVNDSVPEQEPDVDQQNSQVRNDNPDDPQNPANPITRPRSETVTEPARESEFDKVTARISLPGSSFLNGILANWYSQKQNYTKVKSEVLQFYPQGSKNGCVAYLSTALRNVGINIPIEVSGEESPSLVTRPFSRYLEYKLKWSRINDYYSLKSGDVVFTKDAKGRPGYPAHTYMFLKWINIAKGVALVIDNQAFTHERDIFAFDDTISFTPFAYALRAK